MTNVPLLYHDAPELRDILAIHGMHLAEPKIVLSTEELAARFQSLVDVVFGVLGDVRMMALVSIYCSRNAPILN